MTLATKPKPSPHLKKRQAGHHRHSKHYLKPYWPYLPMLGILFVGLLINTYWSALSQHSKSVNQIDQTSLLQSTNSERALSHEQSLALNPQLNAAAQTYANELVAQNVWSSNTPNGTSPWTFIKSAGYKFQLAGENLAYGFSNTTQVINAWLNSSPHRENILSPSYQNVGFGIAKSPNYQGQGAETVVVADYAEPATSAPEISFEVPQPTQSAVTPATTQLPSKPVSRLQLLSATMLTRNSLIISVVTLAIAGLFIFRYGYRIKRAVSIGEALIIHHPVLDIISVLVITLGFIFTRTGGYIR